MTYHTIIIAGHLGRDPEMRYTPYGQPVTSFNLAANRQYAGADGQTIKETTWFRITAWGKTAEACAQYLHKSSLVLVEGRLACDPDSGGPRLYTRQDGTPAAAFEVSANTVRFLSGREGESEPDSHGAAPAQVDDVPF